MKNPTHKNQEKYDHPSAKVYSYCRYSSKKQDLNDSLRRQMDAAIEWCAERGQQLNQDLRPDLAVSGMWGRNLSHGFLGAFLDQVERKKIDPFSTLCCESPDRVSRGDPLDAAEVIRRLTRSNIRIVFLMENNLVLTNESIAEDDTLIPRVMGILARGRNESYSKSKRIKRTFEEKRKHFDTHPWPMGLPPWYTWNPRIKKTDARTYFLNGKEKIIRRIFELYDQGKSTCQIAALFNSECVPRLVKSKRTPKKWRSQTVRHYLTSRNVIGCFTPKKRTQVVKNADDIRDFKIILQRREAVADEIKGYYKPAIIDEDLFLRVNYKLSKTVKVQGRRTEFVNIFRGLLHCPYCSGPIIIKRQKWGDGNYSSKLVCENAMDKDCKCIPYGWNLDHFEETFFTTAEDVQKAYGVEIIDNKSDQQLITVKARIAAVIDEEKRLFGFVKKGTVSLDTLEKELENAKTEREELKKELVRLETETNQSVRSSRQATVEEFLDVISKKDRTRLQSIVGQLFKRIDVYFAGLPSTQKKVMAVYKKLGGGWKAKRAIDSDGVATRQRFYVAFYRDSDKVYPDWITDDESLVLFENDTPKTAEKELKNALKFTPV